MSKTRDAIEWADEEYRRRKMERSQTELQEYREQGRIARLEKLVIAPLGLIDRLYEVRTLLSDRLTSTDDIMNRIAQLREEIDGESGATFAKFVQEAEPMEQELRRQLEQLRELRERAQLVCDIVRSMFRPSAE